MNLDDEPYRVIYTFSGKETTKIFGNKKQAQEFANQNVNAKLQLARETYQNPKPANKFQQPLNKVTCKCGRRQRLRSDPACYACSVALPKP